MTHTVIPTKYCKYPSTTILKHANVLAKVNKLPYECLPNITPHDAYSVKIRVRTSTLENILHKKGVKYHYRTYSTVRKIRP